MRGPLKALQLFNKRAYTNAKLYKDTQKHIKDAKGLFNTAYTCKEFARVENEKVFKQAWTCIGSAVNLKNNGDTMDQMLGDTNITLKNINGNIKCFNASENIEINARTFLSSVFINQNKNTEQANKLWDFQMGDIGTLYGHYPWSNLTILHTKKYVINSNWKLVVDNFCESYHVGWVHPELFQITNVGLYRENQFSGQYMGVIQSDLTKGRTLFSDKSIYFSDLNEIDYDCGYFIHLFPNLSYFIFPHHIVTLNMFPNINEPNKSYEIMNLMVRDDIDYDKNKDEIDELGRFYLMINGEDIGACADTQTGLDADVFHGGRYSGKFEKGLHRFQNILVDYMTDNYMKKYSPEYPN